MTRSFFAALLGSGFFVLLSGTGGVSAQTLTTLYSFSGSPDGFEPRGGLIADASGALYGTTFYGGGGTGCAVAAPPGGCGTVFKLAPPPTTGGPWTETVLYSFNGGSDGANPRAGLIADASGALYGTTTGGGSTGCASCGTVFKLTPPTTRPVDRDRAVLVQW